MINEQKIQSIRIGDKVNVYWENINALIDAEVIYLPATENDNWMLKDNLGNVFNVGNFCKMEKLPIIQQEATDTAWDD